MEHLFCYWEGKGGVGKGDRCDCAAVQMDLDRLQKWTDRKLVEFNKEMLSPTPREEQLHPG